MKMLTSLLIIGLIATGCTTFEPSPIRDARYDAKTKTLTIKFPNGSRYEYAGVPEDLYRGIRGTAKKGAYYHKHIKGKHKATKLAG